MATTGKTGADAWMRTLIKQAQLMASYGPKLQGVISAMEALGLLTASEVAAINAYFAGMAAVAAIMLKVAQYSGFDPR